MYCGINGALCYKTKLQKLLCIYIYFFSSGIKLFSLVVLHLSLLLPPNLFLLALVIIK